MDIEQATTYILDRCGPRMDDLGGIVSRFLRDYPSDRCTPDAAHKQLLQDVAEVVSDAIVGPPGQGISATISDISKASAALAAVQQKPDIFLDRLAHAVALRTPQAQTRLMAGPTVGRA